jgi:chromosome segregation ATPase
MLALGLAAGCVKGDGPAGAREPSPTVAGADEQGPLTAADVQMFLAVREKALLRLEGALDEVESRGGDVLAQVQEVTVAERDAARALGAEWRRFTWVRDQIGRLMTSQRQHEDQRLLGTELARAREDLRAQLAAARDPASRQFLDAQLKALTAQLEKLEHDRQVPAPQAEELRELESARAEIATLQGRQDRIQHRLQELLQRGAAASGPAAVATPAPTARAR